VTKNGKVLTAIAVTVVLVAAAGTGYALWGGSDGSSSTKSLVILDNVQRQTLKDSVTLTGTLAREEQRKVTSVTQGRISALYAKDGETAQAEERLFAIDGRDAITEPGDVEFFRTLSVGDRGDDVIQLKEILARSGFSPGSMDSLFTEQTRFALAQWQAANHYPGATPVSAQTATVSLAQSTGYTVGKQSSAGLIIGPPPASPAAARTGNASTAANLAAFHVGDGVTAAAIPALTIQSTAATVAEGAPATFVINASVTNASAIDISLSSSGASTDDVVYPPSIVTLPANASSVQVVVATRADNLVEADENYTLALVASPGDYTLGSPSSATTKIIDANVPEVHISGGGSISPGVARVLTVTADQAPIRDTQVSVTVAGDATPVQDYKSVNPTVVLRTGHKTAQFTIQTLATDSIRPDKHIVAALAPAAGYRVGSPGSAVVTILGQTGNAALPIVTLQSATTHLTKGEPYAITVSLSKATSSALTINLVYGGNAILGADYTLPGGSIVVPAGTTSLPVMVPTVADNRVESDRFLAVSVGTSSHYRVGSPSSVAATIESKVVPELTITANSTTVALGGAATFTVTADQAPVQNTSVNFQVVGTAQPGQDYEPLLGTTVLLAGQRSVTVTLRSIRKDVVFQPTDMIVGHWPIRVGQVFVKEGDPLPPGTPILSLTDPSFTVTLQASASDRTKLAVGQTCTVKLTGGTKEAEGTISELDQNLTSLAASSPGGTGAQVYEGKINVSDLGAADGASVSIEVTVQERKNVITVPIAAVKQNGSGHDVVRVIDLANRSHVTDVEVTTGLSEGSYIEVRKGLKGDETVIVEVDQPK
jgi:peptidoglycan hydrolase-like protein with peptidoglycan-binding domain